MSAARWVAASRIVLEVAALAASILLAHLLSPAEFGRAIVALIAIPLSTLFLNGVLSPLLIQRSQLTRAHLEAASLLAVGGGVALGLLCIAALPAASALFDAETATLVALAAPAFVLSGLGVVPDAVLRRDLRFRPLALIDLSAALTGTALTVGLALAGLGPAALIVGSLAGNAVGSVAVIRIAGFPRPRWHRAEAAEILRLGGPAGMSGLGTLFFRRIDYLILGARLGAADLGAYWRGYQLGAEYQSKLTTVMLRVAFPLYSRLRNISDMRRVRGRVVRLHATLVVPPLALLIAVAPVLIPFVYGEAWERAVVPTQLLAGVGMLNALVTGVGPLLMALGRASLLNYFAWISGLGYALVIFLVAPYGLVAVSTAALVYVALGFVASQEILVRRPVGIPWSEMLREAGPAFVVGGVIVAAAMPIVQTLDAADVAAPLTLLAAGAAAVVLYLVLTPRVAPAAWADLREITRRRTPAAGDPTAGVPPGTSLDTTDPAPTIAAYPMATPASTTTPTPTKRGPLTPDADHDEMSDRS